MDFSIDYWVERLEDPFETFALVSAAASLGGLVQKREERRFERAGPWGVSSRYYSVEDEHDIEVIEHFIGAAFVLAQATITQTLALVLRMGEEAGNPSWISNDKAKIMHTAAPIHAGTGRSKIALINDIANYYKHRVEWKEEDLTGPIFRKETMKTAAALGLGLGGYHTLENALREFEIYTSDMAALARLVVQWREDLADHIRAEARKNGVPVRSRYPDEDEPNTSA